MNLQNRFHFKPLTLGLVAASVLTLAALGLFATGSQAADAAKPSAEAKAALTVALAQPKSSMLTIKLAANGSVAAWQEASVGAEANGLRVVELHANVGDKVKRGQLLASFAAESVQADVALARAAADPTPTHIAKTIKPAASPMRASKVCRPLAGAGSKQWAWGRMGGV